MDWLAYVFAVPAIAYIFWKCLVMYLPWLPGNIQFIRSLISLVQIREKYEKESLRLYDRLRQQAERIPNHKLILQEDETWSYKQMLLWSNKCGRALHSLGIQSGDKVGLLMMNEPAFLALWSGCSALGGITAFLNTDLRMKSLLYCIDIAEIKILIVGNDLDLLEAIDHIKVDLLERNIKLFVYGKQTNTCLSFSELVDQQTSNNIPRDWGSDANFAEPVCYIYTSGTTDLPRAVNVGYNKCWSGGSFFTAFDKDLQSDDIVYSSLPLYHGVSSLIGFCGVLNAGITLAIRKQFSSHHFWSDCRKYNATVALYIGETLRSVCNHPVQPGDRNHRIRAIVGNGLRPDVWRTFLDRYGKHIKVLELYGATEGNAFFLNYDNNFGCVGTLSPLMKKFGNVAIVKYDPVKGDLVRDKHGHAIHAGTNEPGLLVGKIGKKYKMSSYKGEKQLTEMKILYNVFKEGDSYFNTGDLLKCDENYHVHFWDRVGDTFRWKGENVSTNEVSDIVVQGPGINEANVYGVEIPGCEGRAGMAAVVLKGGELETKALYDYVCENLPSYARPIFIRVTAYLELTGTLKQRKVKLRNEGFDLSIINDKIFFLDNHKKRYIPLTDRIRQGLQPGLF